MFLRFAKEVFCTWLLTTIIGETLVVLVPCFLACFRFSGCGNGAGKQGGVWGGETPGIGYLLLSKTINLDKLLAVFTVNLSLGLFFEILFMFPFVIRREVNLVVYGSLTSRTVGIILKSKPP